MFKNLIIYQVTSEAPVFAEDKFTAMAFQPCGPTQERSIGFVPPREANGPLAECIGGHWILKLMIETKTVPADVLQKRVDEKAAQIEREQGRKPGRKERRDIKDEARLDLLPHAFPKQRAVLVWYDPTARTMAMDTSSQSVADIVATTLVQIMNLDLRLLQTAIAPPTAMADWLVSHQAPDAFRIGDGCVLKSTGESKTTVKYNHHPLDIDEIPAHIMQGKLPTQMALEYADRAAFTLTDSMTLKQIERLDFDVDVGMTLDNDAFDAEIAVATRELAPLIAALVEAMGGAA